MKKIFYIFGILLGLGLASCTNTELDPLDGVFPSPTLIDYTSNATITAEKDDAGRRLFTIDITDGTTPLHAVLVGSKYSLTANQYTEAMDAVAKNGNFIVGKTTIGGKNVKQGTIDVSIVEEKETSDGCENVYYISTILFLEDGTPFKTTWQGKAAFEKDKVLEPELFYTDAVAQDCTLEDGSTPVTDVESHTLTIKDKAGEFVAQIKLIRSNGTKDLSGNYTVKEYAHEDLSAGNGFDLGAMFGMPAGSFVIGTYYVDNGNIVIVQPGETISVTAVENGVYTIDGSTGYSFLIAPEGYVPGGLTVLNAEDTIAQDCTLEDGQTPVTDVESHTIVMKDDAGEFVAQVKLIRALGVTDLSGEYTVKEYAHEDFAAGNGFDLGAMFGMPAGSFVIGTYFVKDGEIVIVGPGETINVSKLAEDTYKFEGAEWAFAGKIKSGDVPPQPQDNFDYTPSAEYNASTNLWKAVDAAKAVKYFYYMNTAADWSVAKYDNVSSTDCPFVEFKESTYKLTFEDQTFDRWQNQVYIYPFDDSHFIALDPAKTYKFKVTLQSDQTFGAFFKLVQYNPDGTPKFEGAAIWEPAGYPDNVNFTAGTPVVLEKEITGVDCSNINLIFDFGKNPAGTTVYIKDIILTDLSAAPAPPVELTDFLSFTSYAQYNINLAGAELATSGFSYTAEFDWTTFQTKYTFSGDGSFIKLELYTEGDSFAAGTYTPSVDANNVAAGEFKTGSAQGGTTWYVVKDNQMTSTPVTDGTVTVAKEGDVYTIEIKSSVVNAKYVGKLSAAPAAPSITIDGDMSDWAAVEGTVQEVDATSAAYITELKGFADADNIYVYVKRAKQGRWNELWGGDSGKTGYYYYDFDLDNNPETGDQTENSHGNYESYCYVYLFGGTADAPVFRETPPGSFKGMTGDNIKINGVVTDTDVEVEASFPRADLAAITGDTISVSVWGNKDGNPITKVTFKVQ